MAARELARGGATISVLEASDRIGGRIHTFRPEGFSTEIEAGAEFIHGELPLTKKLMKEAHLKTVATTGKMYRFENGKRTSGNPGGHWKEFYDKLEKQRGDMTLERFLAKYFPGPEFEELRQNVRNRALGLDLADPSALSVMGIRREWLSDETQSRPAGGYGALMRFLLDDSQAHGCKLHLRQRVSAINWKDAVVETDNGKWAADKIVLTSSLGSLQRGDIRFVPEIPQTTALFSRIGFGQVIKILLEFSHPFWESACPGMGFLFTDGGPTFWTQHPRAKPLLTGWIGAQGMVWGNADDDALIDFSLGKLQDAFMADRIDVRQHFTAGKAFRYTAGSVSAGGYSWLKMGSKSAIVELNRGIGGKLYFAGEALHPGTESGTVESALQSGRFVARKLMR
jgi:monoamine oxidase